MPTALDGHVGATAICQLLDGLRGLGRVGDGVRPEPQSGLTARLGRVDHEDVARVSRTWMPRRSSQARSEDRTRRSCTAPQEAQRSTIPGASR